MTGGNLINDYGFHEFLVRNRDTVLNLIHYIDDSRTNKLGEIRINLIWEEVRSFKPYGGRANDFKPAVARLYNHAKRGTAGPLFDCRPSRFDELPATYLDALWTELMEPAEMETADVAI